MADILLPIKRKLNAIRYRSDPVVFQGRGRRYSIKCPVPPDAERESWGDFHFAVALAKAISRKGNYARVDLMAHWYNDIRPQDINIVLRGLTPFEISSDTSRLCLNVMWNISHPSQVRKSEKLKYDLTFAAGIRDGYELLLQGSDPMRFNTNVKPVSPLNRPLFVGNARNGKRQVVTDCLKAGVPIYIIGRGWDNSEAKQYVITDRVRNEDLPQWYASAPIVLNDHEEDMQEHGFLNNRAFDALSVGTPVVQPHMAEWLSDYLSEGLHQYHSIGGLEQLLRRIKGPWLPAYKPSLSLHQRADILMSRATDVFNKKFLIRYRDESFGETAAP